MLIDSTTVAVAARGHLTLPAALPMLAEAVEEGGVHYMPPALEQLQHLRETRSVTIYLPAGQAHAAEWFRERGFTIGRIRSKRWRRMPTWSSCPSTGTAVARPRSASRSSASGK